MVEPKLIRRKIQLVAGVTYSVSLPKQWVQKYHLKGKQEISMIESGDGSLVISPSFTKHAGKIENFSIEVEELEEDVSQVLFVLYYLGTENITLFSKKEIPHGIRATIKDVLRYMIGTEIVYEDNSKIQIKVLLDKTKVDGDQLYYRMALLIATSVDALLSGNDLKEIEINEERSDRLYHLISKIIVLSYTHPDILHSSKVGNVYYLSSYQRIAKKLENLSDCILSLSIALSKRPQFKKDAIGTLQFTRKHIIDGMNFFMNKHSRSFTKAKKDDIAEESGRILKCKDVEIAKYLGDMLRYTIDIEEELTNISFFTKLLKQKII